MAVGTPETSSGMKFQHRMARLALSFCLSFSFREDLFSLFSCYVILEVFTSQIYQCLEVDIQMYFIDFLKIFFLIYLKTIFGHGLFEVCCLFFKYLSGFTGSSLRHGGSCSPQGSKLGSLRWEHRLFTLHRQGSLCRFISKCAYQILVILLNS